TLLDVLRDLRSRPALPARGAELFRLGRSQESAEPPLTPPRNYVEAVLWVGARLAEGLAHAHRRGILHRDLKPANVLLGDNGQPMLLDFNLAEDIKQRGADAALLGGTLPYMAPEQMEAFLSDGEEAG